MTVFERYGAQWINPELQVVPEIVIPDKSQGEKIPSPSDFIKKKTNVPVRPASYLKKKFFCCGKDGKLYLTAHGVYICYINGNRVSSVLAPEPAEYDRRLPYQEYDLNGYLKEGENEILIVLAGGWWRGKTTNDGVINGFGNDVALLCVLTAWDTFVVSDESWFSSQSGAIRFNDNMDGEIYDARKENISEWHAVKAENFGYDHLVAEQGTIAEQETFSAKLIETPNGEQVLDFGQNLAGYVRFNVRAEEGQKITLVHGEALDGNGNFTTENIQSPNNEVKQRVDYICKKGLNFYQPTTCYFGFRYVKVVAECPIRAEDFTAVAVYSQMPQTGFFECGNGYVNKLFQNALWSMKSNFVGVPTDCPTREKSGFSGDLQVFAHTALYLADCREVMKKWLRELAATQFADGCIKQIAPDPRARSIWDGGAGWCNAFEIVLSELAESYPDGKLYREFYEPVKRWIDYCLKRAKESTRKENEENPYQDYFYDTGMHWGEWLEPNANPAEYLTQTALHGEPEVATAYLANGCKILAKMAERLGKNEDSRYYADCFQKARLAYRYAFVKNGRIVSERMCRFVRPLMFGLLEQNEAVAAAKDLNALIEKNGFRLNTGFLTTHALLRVLTDYGYADTAYRLLLQEEFPSWLFAVKNGLTTIPESWNFYDQAGNPKNSFNHYAFGAVVGWLFDSVAGIRLKDGGIVICPHPNRSLGFIKAEYRSPYGVVKSEWRYEGETPVYAFTVPDEIECIAVFPDGKSVKLSGGITQF